MSLTAGQDTWTEVRGRYPTGRNTTAALSAHTEGKCTGRYNTGRASVRRSNTLRIAGSNDQMNALEFRQLYPFPSKRFHALLNSLFKVLCNFPSRYLFAIGLVAVFSLRWGLPPSLDCDLRQSDSKSQPTATNVTLTGLAPSLDNSLSQENLGWSLATDGCDYTLQVRTARGRRIQRWAFPHSLAVTRGILVSFLSSA